MKNIRRGQMEIMGLIVVVILLTMGMFFIVAFQANKPPTQVKQSFEDDQLASNFILAFLKTSAGCRNYDMEDLVQDCAIEQKITCNGFNSCEYVTSISSLLIDNTLKLWGKEYNFEITGMTQPVKFNKSCGATDEKDSAFQPISLYPYSGLVTIKLDVCD